MDNDKLDKLLTEFADMYQAREADPAKAVGLGKDDLRLLKMEISDVSAEAETPALDDAVRQRMAGKRWPQLQEITRQFAQGLTEFKDVAPATAEPDVLLGAVALDIATGRIIKAAENVQSGGHNGSIMAAAAADGLVNQCLTQAEDDIQGSSLPDDVRSDVGVAFAPAFQLRQAKQEREQKLKDRQAHATQPLQQNLDDAQQRAANAHLLDAFFAAIKPSQK